MMLRDMAGHRAAGLSTSRSAISRLVPPAATSVSTPRSRPVSGAVGAAPRSSSRTRAASGSAPRAAKVASAASSSRRAVSRSREADQLDLPERSALAGRLVGQTQVEEDHEGGAQLGQRVLPGLLGQQNLGPARLAA